MLRPTFVLFFLVVGIAGILASCTSSQPPTSRQAATISPPSRAATQPSNYAGLHNVVTYADGLYSGAVPEGAEGFATLKALGIKTIISVDGAAPDVELARKMGMRYVHLPIGYNGMDKTRTLEIARAIQDLPGPVYVHCHHGKHRSAAAAGAAAVTLGLLSTDAALAEMKVSGTAPNYLGLFKCVSDASPATPEQLRAASNAFPEKNEPRDLVQMMVNVDETTDALKAIEKAGWKAPSDHPDLVPAAEAGRLADLFRTVHDPKMSTRPAEFATMMQSQSDHAAALEKSLLAGAAATELSAQLKVVTQSCTQCHARFRD